MEALLCNLVCARSPFLEHSSGLRVFFFKGSQLGVLSGLLLHQGLFPSPESGVTPWVCELRAQLSDLAVATLEISHKVIFEFVFCKQSLMTLTAEYTHTHTHTRIHKPACGHSRQCAEGTARPRSKLRLVTVVVATAEALMAALATAPEKGEAPRGSHGSLVKPPEPV